MSIPERLYKIARYKLNEVKERFEQLDEEAQREWEARQQRRADRDAARRELDESNMTPLAADGPDMRPPRSAPPPTAGPMYTPPNAASPNATPPGVTPLPRRTPEEIARGLQPNAPQPNTMPQSTAPASATTPDPLLPHYRVFNLAPGADFAAVQAAYHRLAARSDPERFPAGSPEQETARTLRAQIETAYQELREALDPTARRFNLLDFEAPGSAPE